VYVPPLDAITAELVEHPVIDRRQEARRSVIAAILMSWRSICLAQSDDKLQARLEACV
jgi:hypothetical protein